MPPLSIRCLDADPAAAATLASRLDEAGTIDAEGIALVTLSDGLRDGMGPIDALVVGDGIDPETLSDSIDVGSIPVVWCPAAGDETLASRALDHGAADYLPRNGEWESELADRVERAATAAPSDEYERKIRRLQSSVAELVGFTEEMTVYRHLAETAREVLGFDRSIVAVETDGLLIPIVRTRSTGVDGARSMTVDQGLVGETFSTGESRLVTDLSTDPTADPARPEYRSGISVPIGTVGVFQAVGHEPEAFDRTDLALAELLCASAAAVVSRIASEREQRLERDRFAALFENVPDPVVYYRYDDVDPVVRSVNPAFETVFGVDGESAIGETLDSLIVPPEATERAERLNDRVAAGERLDVDVVRETASGPRSFLLRNAPVSTGETRAGYAIYTDISEQKRHQETLAALGETARRLIRADSEAAIGEQLVETAQDVLSLPYAAVLRYRPDEGLLRPVAVSERWGDLDGDPIEYLTFESGESLTWRAFETGEVRIYGDITAEPKVGRESPKVRSAMTLPIGEHGVFLVGSTAADAFDETDLDFAGVLTASAEAAFDRTDRETTLREREVELARQNRRLERFASVVSHDLRNPLTVASGRLALAQEGEDGQLDAIEDALVRIECIIEDVLALARDADAIDPGPIDLAACAREAWDGVETDGATLSIEGSTTVHADRSRLRQVFENLFRNSVEHGSTSNRNASRSGDSVEHGSTCSRDSMDPGDIRGSGASACQPESPGDSGDSVEHGSTSNRNASRSGDRAGDSPASNQQSKISDDSVEQGSTCSRDPSDPGDSVEHGSTNGGLTVRVGTVESGFFVADDGPGIPPAERESVFEHGHSGDGGSGLGLAIVEEIVRAHGWDVSIADDETGGARFEIRTESSD